ncbi:MAG: hypothetical protein JNK48_31810 [Bryobacterales bacterium]|nr:hypothetical protein [Bryobacterales bacterium]
MWTTSLDNGRKPVKRTAGSAAPGAAKSGAGPALDPDYVRLVRILDEHPDAKRQVIETLTRKG